jgi:hypothetical protein
MAQLVVLLMGILVWLSPLLFVGGLLALAGRRDRRALAATACQTQLSDALADEVGVIVAPLVRRRLGRWRVRVAVPLGQPHVVARIVRALHRTLGRLGLERYEIVLTPQEPAPSPTALGRSSARPARAA